MRLLDKLANSIPRSFVPSGHANVVEAIFAHGVVGLEDANFARRRGDRLRVHRRSAEGKGELVEMRELKPHFRVRERCRVASPKSPDEEDVEGDEDDEEEGGADDGTA